MIAITPNYPYVAAHDNINIENELLKQEALLNEISYRLNNFIYTSSDLKDYKKKIKSIYNELNCIHNNYCSTKISNTVDTELFIERLTLKAVNIYSHIKNLLEIYTINKRSGSLRANCDKIFSLNKIQQRYWEIVPLDVMILIGEFIPFSDRLQLRFCSNRWKKAIDRTMLQGIFIVPHIIGKEDILINLMGFNQKIQFKQLMQIIKKAKNGVNTLSNININIIIRKMQNEIISLISEKPKPNLWEAHKSVNFSNMKMSSSRSGCVIS